MRILVLPVKALARAKTRLSPVLSPMERAALTLAMLEDALDAAIPTGWEVWVISPDEAALEIAVRRQVRPIQEERRGLRVAIRQVDDEATELGADAMGVLLADTPLVNHDALADALHTLGPVVLAPSADGGTNLLLRRPPRAVPPRFGGDSFTKHRAAAEAKGLPVATVERPELAFDLDDPDDILTFLDDRMPGRTSDVCEQLGLAERLRVRA